MEFIPVPMVFTVVFLFGIVIGSFLNVVICRLHTGRSLNNRSHCLSCGRTLAWYDLVPVVSYVALLGRCRTCGGWIPLRYVLVEILTGVGFVLVFATAGTLVAAVCMMIVIALLVVIGAYDMYHFIIPDELVLALAGVGIAVAGYAAYLNGDIASLTHAALAAGIAFLFFGGLWYISDGRWIGFGDAKLAAPLALLVGIHGVFSFIVLSFWIGAGISLLIVGIDTFRHRRLAQYCAGGVIEKTRGYRTMKREVPFAPFLILAFICVFFFQIDVLTLINYVITRQ